jgi:hypothetical protein
MHTAVLGRQPAVKGCKRMLTMLLVLGFCASVLCFGWFVLLARFVASSTRDQRATLRRCKKKLRVVRRELDRIPATREICDMYKEIEDTERTIERTETWFHHAAGN